ncbi:MAG: hypothetical protein Q8N38_02550, partial [Bacteroidales bacterium]|nr:hypothetical protein [Bacteroidales bacterium]
YFSIIQVNNTVFFPLQGEMFRFGGTEGFHSPKQKHLQWRWLRQQPEEFIKGLSWELKDASTLERFIFRVCPDLSGGFRGWFY